jgi:hypothetical protein
MKISGQFDMLYETELRICTKRGTQDVTMSLCRTARAEMGTNFNGRKQTLKIPENDGRKYAVAREIGCEEGRRIKLAHDLVHAYDKPISAE